MGANAIVTTGEDDEKVFADAYRCPPLVKQK